MKKNPSSTRLPCCSISLFKACGYTCVPDTPGRSLGWMCYSPKKFILQFSVVHFDWRCFKRWKRFAFPVFEEGIFPQHTENNPNVTRRHWGCWLHLAAGRRTHLARCLSLRFALRHLRDCDRWLFHLRWQTELEWAHAFWKLRSI